MGYFVFWALYIFLIQVQQIILELDMQNIKDDLAEHLSEVQKRKLTFGIATLGDPQVRFRHWKNGGCKSHAGLLAIVMHQARSGYAYVYKDILQLFLVIIFHAIMWK